MHQDLTQVGLWIAIMSGNHQQHTQMMGIQKTMNGMNLIDNGKKYNDTTKRK